MYIANEPLVEHEDISRYFRDCYVLDPHTGFPSIVTSINKHEVMLTTFPPSSPAREAYYTGEQLRPFLCLDTYTVPELGWRDDRGCAVYLERMILSSGGVRGLNALRVRKVYPSHLASDKPLVSGPSFSSTRNCIAIFNPPAVIPLRSAIKKLSLGKHVILRNNLAALRVDGSPEFVLAYNTTIVGVGVLDKVPQVKVFAPRIIKLLGDCDGIEVTTV